jgi:hypothetical protein
MGAASGFSTKFRDVHDPAAEMNAGGRNLYQSDIIIFFKNAVAGNRGRDNGAPRRGVGMRAEAAGAPPR